VRLLRGARRGRRRTQGGRSNYKDRLLREDEPADHGIGRSRGGLTSKTHALVDGKGRLLVCIISPGQAGDSPVLPMLLAELRVNSHGPGRPRTTPLSLRGDKAYSSRGHRQLLRSRGIKAVIPEPADQIANRQRKGSGGGRPVDLDVEDYKQRNVVERFFNRLKNWRGIASRYDKLATVFRGSVILAAIVDWLR
jgi:transposase